MTKLSSREGTVDRVNASAGACDSDVAWITEWILKPEAKSTHLMAHDPNLGRGSQSSRKCPCPISGIPCYTPMLK